MDRGVEGNTVFS